MGFLKNNDIKGHLKPFEGEDLHQNLTDKLIEFINTFEYYYFCDNLFIDGIITN